MAYIGTDLGFGSGFVTTVKDTFAGDGSATNFTLSRAVTSELDLEVFVGNVRQNPLVAYTVSGTTLAFTGTPANGEVIYAVHQAGALSTLSPNAFLGAKDFSISGNLSLIKDSAVLNFGVDSDITLTHAADTGLTTNGTFTATTLAGRKGIKTEFNASGAVTATLTVAESGSTVLIHGTNNNIINLPSAATTNPGLYYDFIVLTAVGGSTTTIVNIAGSGGNFVGSLSLAGGTAANAVFDNAGDTFTFVAGSVVGSRARITCLTDDGTNGVWQVESVASPIATIA
jgi:hypothetical protein